MGPLALSGILYYILVPSFLTVVVLCILVRKFSKPYQQGFNYTKKEKQYFDPKEEKYKDFPSILDKSSIHLSVIVPAYDEQNRLPSMLDECLQFLESVETSGCYNYEVIIVNDGSKDKTSDVALGYVKKYTANKVRLLELETNRGKGGAVYMGIQCARGAVILFADADGATTFDDLTKLESALELLLKNDYKINPEVIAEESAIICGSRAHLEKEASAKRSLFRTILMHGFHFLVWLFAVRSIRDTQCGFKLLTRKAARLCFRSLHIKRWAFDVELLYIAERYNIPIVEIAVRWTEIEGSKLVPFWSWLQMGRDLFLIWFRYTIGAWKLAERED
ncbi:UNVERIFIED_CONTAM: hypothetical protein PYX00_000342 [Menopon gallinae]|uniref:Dolichyl-phosphate beta-glucosyltransferase n=1 Tax=Menopon gallinae TaxID=328185 RepID=A0AAW2I9Q6_9NEOP